MWDLSAQPGKEPSFPALQNGLLITRPPGKSLTLQFYIMETDFLSFSLRCSWTNFCYLRIFLPQLPHLSQPSQTWRELRPCSELSFSLKTYCGRYDVLYRWLKTIVADTTFYTDDWKLLWRIWRSIPMTKPFRTSAISLFAFLSFLCSSESHFKNFSFAHTTWLIVWFKGPSFQPIWIVAMPSSMSLIISSW